MFNMMLNADDDFVLHDWLLNCFYCLPKIVFIIQSTLIKHPRTEQFCFFMQAYYSDYTNHQRS